MIKICSPARVLARLATVLIAAALVAAEEQPAAAQEATGSETSSATLFLPAIAKQTAFVNPSPAPGATGQSPNAALAWQFTDASLPEPRYTVLLNAGNPKPDTPVADAITAAVLDPFTFEPGQTYYWQVIAQGSNGQSQAGPVWSFTVERIADPPPIGTMAAVPAGEFQMGCDTGNPGPGTACSYKDTPLHRVWLDAFAIDKFEVTNGEYAQCVAAGACQPPRRTNSHEREDYYGNPQYAFYPVLYVSREDALAYCGWVGKRLPTEAEWEKAARGPLDTRPYPWGIEAPTCSRQNRPMPGPCEDDLSDTARVGLFPAGASMYGVYDLGANVFEWVQDRYNEYYYQSSPYRNPVNTNSGKGGFYGIRGGSYRDNLEYTRTFHRHFGHHGDSVGGDAPYYRNDRVGFRCAKSMP